MKFYISKWLLSHNGSKVFDVRKLLRNGAKMRAVSHLLSPGLK